MAPKKPTPGSGITRRPFQVRLPIGQMIQLRQHAARTGTTMTAIIERGIDHVMREESLSAEPRRKRA
jgi:hypothetical protein